MGRYIGIDLGTTSISGVVVDTERRETVVQQTIANNTETTSTEDRARGRSEWEMDAMIARAIALAAELTRRAGAARIDGIGVTGQMHGMVLTGRDRLACAPFIGWQDARCLEKTPAGVTWLEEMVARGGAGFSKSGCRPATGYLASTLFWRARNGGVPQGATACFAPDYLVSQLTGAGICSDPTNAASAGVYDVHAGRWNHELIRALELDVECFPKVAPSCARAGGLTRATAKITGLAEGTPVAVACGDNQASFAGSVSESLESVLVNVGTGGQVSAYAESAADSPLLDVRPYLQGGYLLVGPELCGGRSYQVLRDFMRKVGEQVFGVTETHEVYEKLNALAAAVPSGADGLRCDPVFAGSRAEPGARAKWRGMNDVNFTPGHMARALLEGLAERFHALYAEMLRGGAAVRGRLVGAGNGVRQNALLREILADRFEMPVTIVSHAEEAATGAALCAAVTTGEFKNIHDASRSFIRSTALD